ncbi:hypothetical protein G3M55_15530, partial [Streptomyces sp. SID8455]|nr:hypothetical protein [Streptomyces sp. SID8455]
HRLGLRNDLLGLGCRLGLGRLFHGGRNDRLGRHRLLRHRGRSDLFGLDGRLGLHRLRLDRLGRSLHHRLGLRPLLHDLFGLHDLLGL